MNNIIRIDESRKSRERIREEACAWLACLDKGIEQEEIDALATWLDENPLHSRMLFNMAAMWDMSDVLSELSEIFPLAEIDVSTGAMSNKRKPFSAALAASLVFVVGALLFLWQTKSWWQSDALQETYVTAIGERRQINLPDGSVITLNTGSSTRVTYDPRERAVVLEKGEAFFSVAKDKSRPFRVYVGDRVVEAVGTAFTVQRIDAAFSLEVLVTEGEVRLLNKPSRDERARQLEISEEDIAPKVTELVDEIIPVIAGEKLVVSQQEERQKIEKEQLQPEDVEVKLAWRVGMLVFQGDTLETVLQEVSRYTNIKLEAEDSIRNIRIDGLFRAGDIDALLVSMEKNFNLSSRRLADDQIVITASNEE